MFMSTLPHVCFSPPELRPLPCAAQAPQDPLSGGATEFHRPGSVTRFPIGDPIFVARRDTASIHSPSSPAPSGATSPGRVVGARCSGACCNHIPLNHRPSTSTLSFLTYRISHNDVCALSTRARCTECTTYVHVLIRWVWIFNVRCAGNRSCLALVDHRPHRGFEIRTG